MEPANRAIAKMWKHRGHECIVFKRGNQWVITLTKENRTLNEAIVESPGEAIRLADEWFQGLTLAG
jgi:hypothetical protein